MNSPVIVDNPVWLKATLVFGFLAFGASAAYCLAFSVWLASSLQASAVMVGPGLIFGGLVVAIWPLIRCLNRKLEIDDEGVVVRNGRYQQSYVWPSLRSRVRTTLQVIEVHEKRGGLIFAVDFKAKNAVLLMRRIEAMDASRRQTTASSGPRLMSNVRPRAPAVMAGTAYHFGVLGYKLIGAGCALFFGACSVGAILQKQYSPIAGFALFVALGLYMMVSAGQYEISEQSITNRILFGRFRMAWSEVRKVEFGPGCIVLHGDNKRFVIAPPALWSGKQKREAYALLRSTIDKLGVPRYLSNTADFKIHNNVRVRTARA